MCLNNRVLLSQLTPSLEQCGRFILCDFILFDEDWRVVLVYAPSTVNEGIGFFFQLFLFCGCNRNVVVQADFSFRHSD